MISAASTPPLASASASSCHTAFAPCHTITATSSRWLSWAGDDLSVLRVIAVFLPFSDADLPLPVPAAFSTAYHSSFLSLARTCRRAYEVLTSDAACWSTQRLRIELSEPLFEQEDFVVLSGPDRSTDSSEQLALRVDRFTERRQETVRRLIGEDLFHRLILPNMTAVCQVSLSVPVFAVDERGVAHRTDTAEVYPDLETVWFNPELPALLRPVNWAYGCYSFLLLPSYIRLAPAVATTPAPRLCQPDVQRDCLHRLLQRLPAVQELTVEPSQRFVSAEQVDWRWRVVFTAMPHLRSLSVLNLAINWHSALKLLLTAELSELRSLHIDSSTAHTFRIYGPPTITFHFPLPSPASSAAAADMGPDSVHITTVQLRLRLALCRHILQHLRDTCNNAPRVVTELADIERDVLVKLQAHSTAQPTAQQQTGAKRSCGE